MAQRAPGSIRSRHGGVSCLRIPNALLESRGLFQPHRDPLVERLDKWRTLGAILIALAALIHFGGGLGGIYRGIDHVVRPDSAATQFEDCQGLCNRNTALGVWFVQILLTIWLVIGVLALVGAVLVLTAEPGYRKAALWQLRWPAISFVSWCGLVVGIYTLYEWMYNHWYAHAGFIVGWLMVLPLVALFYLLLKSLRLVANGLFRADDGHPLLAPFAVVPVVWASSIILFFWGGTGGEKGVHGLASLALSFGGAATVTLLSLFTLARLRRRNPYWPFRRGPVTGASVPPVTGTRLGVAAVTGLWLGSMVLGTGAAVGWGFAGKPVFDYMFVASTAKTCGASTKLRSTGTYVVGPHARVTSVAFSPDGRGAAFSSNDGLVRFLTVACAGWFDVATNHFQGAVGVTSLAYSPNGTILAAADAGGWIHLFDVTNPAAAVLLPDRLRPADTNGSSTKTVAFSPNGKLLASGGNKLHLWDMHDPAHATDLGGYATNDPNPIYSVAFSPDGRIVATATLSGLVRLWDVTNPGHATEVGQPILSDPKGVPSVAFSPNGRVLAAAGGSGKVWLWNVADPAHAAPLGQPISVSPDPLDGLAFSPNGHTLAVGLRDRAVRLYAVTDPAHPAPYGGPLTGFDSFVDSVAFSPDGHTLVAGAGDNTVLVWALP